MPRPARAGGTAEQANGTSTRERLLEGAVRRAVREGSGALSLQAIADDAQVSKALLLYHFRDKDDLLASLVAWLTTRVTDREGGALADCTPATVLEALWRWLEQEIARGELLMLIELSTARGVRTRQAVAASALARHETAEASMTEVLRLLRMQPRVPLSMLAATELAAREGLVLSAAREPERPVRAAFDVFWLALLRLAQ